MSAVLQLSPSETYEFITFALRKKRVPYVSGPSAIGKSKVVHKVADDANALMIDMRLSQKLSEDLSGLPERDEQKGKAVYLPFEDIPLEGDTVPSGFSGWLLFLDELSSASEEVLAAAYSLILDRMIGGKKLHPKCLVVAAGNRASDSAIARELPDTLITRMLPVEMVVNSKDWIWWAKNDAKAPNDSVISFIQKDPKMLYAPTKAKDRAELETYPTPRGWESVMDFVNLHEADTKEEVEEVDNAGVPTGKMTTKSATLSPVIVNLISASVGPMAARSFKEEYDENMSLPYPWEIAQSPSSTRIPSSTVQKARLMEDLSKFFMESDGQTREHLLVYINRVGGEHSELFVNKIAGKLKDTPSDKRLLQETAERLNIDPLLGTAPGGESDSSNPF